MSKAFMQRQIEREEYAKKTEVDSINVEMLKEFYQKAINKTNAQRESNQDRKAVVNSNFTTERGNLKPTKDDAVLRNV